MSTEELSQDGLVERVQVLSERMQEVADPAAREAAEGLVSAVMDLYGEGLERILRALDEAGPEAAALRKEIVDDGVVASLLLIHGLYPISLEERIMQALDNVRPFLGAHGGDVDLVSVEDGIARLRLKGSCDGCPASAATLENALKEAIDETAPDLLGLEVEGVVGLDDKKADATPGLALPMVQVGAPSLPMADAPYTECPSGIGK